LLVAEGLLAVVLLPLRFVFGGMLFGLGVAETGPDSFVVGTVQGAAVVTGVWILYGLARIASEAGFWMVVAVRAGLLLVADAYVLWQARAEVPGWSAMLLFWHGAVLVLGLWAWRRGRNTLGPHRDDPTT
jgi:hypothetical protein